MTYEKLYTQTEQMVLSPKELCQIQATILNKLNQKIATCTKAYGYITSIQHLHSYHNIISRFSGDCIFTVRYSFKALKPEIGHCINVSVDAIFKEGIFTQYAGMNILIPSNECPGWTYTNGMFKNETSNRAICVGDTIEIRITCIKYDHHQYKCIGVLKDG
jgi:DNA-directed RNA polymerase subunit E'/Rpb7